MKKLAISRRYAKALMLIGKDDNQADSYREELGGVAHLMETDKAFAQVICNPLYDTGDRRRVLQAVIEKLGLSAVMASFTLLLFDKGRIGFVGDISEFYNKLVDDMKNISRASLVSATELSENAVEKIQSGLSKMTGKQVVLDVRQDSDLIGGVVTKIGDLVYDGSIKTQLRNLRESFKRGEGI